MSRTDPGMAANPGAYQRPMPLCTCGHAMLVHHVDAHGARRTCSACVAGVHCGCKRYMPDGGEVS